MHKLTKEEVESNVMSFSKGSASLLEEMEAQTQDELDEDIGKHNKYAWSNPMRSDWELIYQTRLVKMADKLKRKVNQMVQQQMMKLSFIVILVAALSTQF